MKTGKRGFLSFIICLAILFGMLPTVAFADGGVVFEAITPAEAKSPGDSFDVSFIISSNDGMCIANLTVDYDAEKLQLNSMTKGTAVAGTYTFTLAESSVLWENDDTSANNSTAGSAVFFTANFTVREGATSGDTLINLKGTENDPDTDVITFEAIGVPTTFTPATVTIAGAAPAATTFKDGNQTYTFDQAKAVTDTLTLTNQNVTYNFVGWFSGLDAANMTGISYDSTNDHYILSLSGSSPQTYSVAECRPKYDPDPMDGNEYHALWYYNANTTVAVAYVTSDCLKIYTGSTAVTDVIAANTAASTASAAGGIIKLIKPISLTEATDSIPAVARHFDLNGQTLTGLLLFRYTTNNRIDSSKGNGTIVPGSYTGKAMVQMLSSTTELPCSMSLYDVNLTSTNTNFYLLVGNNGSVPEINGCTFSGSKNTTQGISMLNPATIGVVDNSNISMNSTGKVFYSTSNTAIVGPISNCTFNAQKICSGLKGLEFGDNNTLSGTLTGNTNPAFSFSYNTVNTYLTFGNENRLTWTCGTYSLSLITGADTVTFGDDNEITVTGTSNSTSQCLVSSDNPTGTKANACSVSIGDGNQIIYATASSDALFYRLSSVEIGDDNTVISNSTGTDSAVFKGVDSVRFGAENTVRATNGSMLFGSYSGNATTSSLTCNVTFTDPSGIYQCASTGTILRSNVTVDESALPANKTIRETNGLLSFPDIWDVTFDSNGGSAVAAQRVLGGETITVPEAPTRGGYEFVGWFAGASETAYDFDTPVTGNLTLTAHWLDTRPEYEFFYTLNSATDSDDDEYIEYNVGDSVTATVYLRATNGATVEGFELSVANDANLTRSAASSAYGALDVGNSTATLTRLSGAQSITLPADEPVAVATISYTLGSGAVYDTGLPITIQSDPTITLNGAATAISAQESGSYLLGAEAMTTYTVTYDGNGGTTLVPMYDSYMGLGVCTKQHNVAMNLIGALDPSMTAKTGYDFLGWSEDSSASEPTYSLTGTTAIPANINRNVTLYAVWQIQTFTVTWKDQNGTILETDTGVEYNSTPEYNGETPTGKQSTQSYAYGSFLGWNTSKQTGLSTATTDLSAYQVTNDVTFWAVYEAENQSWKSPTYEWDIDENGGTCTAIRRSNSALDPDYAMYAVASTSSSNNEITSVVNSEPTCTTAGSKTYTAKSFKMGTSYVNWTSNQTTTVEIPAIGHDWGEWSVTTPATCTAAGVENRVCANDSNHTETREIPMIAHTLTAHEAVAATCTVAGSSAYWSCDVCGKYFSDASGENEIAVDSWVLPATGHSYGAPTYTWAADNSTVTATRVCANDPSHVETETVNTTSEITTAATCTAEGVTTYTATFANAAFETQTKNVAIGTAAHTPGEVVIENRVEATCTENGSYDAVFYCTLCGTEISRQHETIEATDHNWGTASYVWAENNSSVTATRVCANNANHVETETVNTTYAVTNQPTCTTTGTGVYTATFTNTAFTSKSKNVDIPALGHDWNEPTYVWAEDNSTVTATRVCANDANHVETETAATTYAVTLRPTVNACGEGTYTADFTNAAFATQTRTVPIDKLAGYTVTVGTKLSGAESAVSETLTCDYGATVTRTADPAPAGCTFLGWYQPNGKLLTSNETYSHYVTSSFAMEAWYQHNSGTVTFIALNKVVKVLSGVSEVESSDFPEDALAKDGYTFTGWDKTPEQVNTALAEGVNVTVSAIYVKTSNSFVVTIYNGNSDAPTYVECTESKDIRLIAEAVDGMNFDHWTANDVVVDYNANTWYWATGEVTLRAHYSMDAVTPQATALITSASYNANTRKAVFVAKLVVPDSGTIVKAGLVAAPAGYYTEELTADNAQFVKTSANAVGTSAPFVYTWTKTKVNVNDTWCVRAYLVYTWNGSEYTVYGDLTTLIAK